MIKPTEIRDLIARSNKYLMTNPDKLQVFLDDGNIVCRGANLNFEYRYTLNIIVFDFAHHANLIILPLLVYLRKNQPDIFENHQKSNNAIKFEVDFLKKGLIDLSIKIDLTERVFVSTNDKGRLEAVHKPEPDHPEFPDEDIEIDIYNRRDDEEYLGTITVPAWLPEF